MTISKILACVLISAYLTSLSSGLFAFIIYGVECWGTYSVAPFYFAIGVSAFAFGLYATKKILLNYGVDIDNAPINSKRRRG